MASGRRIEALKAYISVQPRGYIRELLAEKYIPEIETATLGPRHLVRMARSKIFPIRGEFYGE
jgi:hypothetical protein